jgi:hypothetical protein
MDYQMVGWKKFEESERYNSLLPSLWEKIYWRTIHNAVKQEKINSWAYRWLFSMWENGAMAISPGVNLTENIGLNGKGTHINTNTKVLGRKVVSIGKKVSLLGSDYSDVADDYTMKNEYRISALMDLLQWGYYLSKK